MGPKNADRRNETESSGHLPILLFCYDREKEKFWNIIFTGDESWAHHYDPERKRQSTEFRHLHSSSSRF